MESPGKGTLLIANPFLKDPNFVRTVILVCEHIDEGTFGFVLNKVNPQSLSQLIPPITADFPVLLGGPVQKDTLHFLHQYPDIIIGGEEVLKDVYWGGNFESLRIHLENESIDHHKIRFFVGYSGWTEGQLDKELSADSWLTVSATRKLIFDTPPADIWKESIRLLGGDYEMLINYPLDPQLN